LPQDNDARTTALDHFHGVETVKLVDRCEG